MSRLNVGCGQTPTEGWKNYDNSPSVRLAKKPLTTALLSAIGVLQAEQKSFIEYAQKNAIGWADVTRHIPEPDASVTVIYSSHMLEHVDCEQAKQFLKESLRVLMPGGVIRIAVPNIRFHVENYLQHNDADRFIQDTLMTRHRNKSLLDKLKYLRIGDRHHVWMYDGPSLCKLLFSAGFKNPQIMEAGRTTIKDPGSLNLSERAPESVFVEATKA